MNRRSFIAAFMSAVAVSAVPVGALDIVDPYAGLRVILAKYQSLIDDLDAEKAGGNKIINSDERIDEILSLTLDYCPAPTRSEEEKRQIKHMFSNPERYDIMQVPPAMLLTLFPVAFMRDCLCYHVLLFSPSKVKSWGVFAERYQDLILTA